MNNIALSIVLFVVYFCFVSCALYSQKNIVISVPEDRQPIEREIEKMLDEIYEVAPSEQEIDLFELPEMPIEPAPQPSKENKKLSSSKTSKEIDIAKLNLRQARVACGVLGIKQKVNDHDCNQAWMQKQINQRIKEKPEKVSEVYKAIALKFPDVVIPSINQAQARIA